MFSLKISLVSIIILGFIIVSAITLGVALGLEIEGMKRMENVSDQEFQIGDKVVVLEGVHKDRIGTIAQFTGSLYYVEGLPHEYMGEEYFTGDQLELVDMENQFQGVQDVTDAWRFLINSIMRVLS